MGESRERLWISCCAALLVAFSASAARANGRFPAADQLVIDPSDASHIVVRTTFGFVETRDAGQSFRWICEDIVGRIGAQDPPLAITGDGTLVVAVPFQGLAVSHDHGCSWSQAPAPLAGQLAVDVTLEPGVPASLLALTSTGESSVPPENAPEFKNLLVETRDDARSWAVLGSPLPRDFIAAALDVAPSDPNRIYVSGVVGDPAAAVVERTEDRGETWTRVGLETPMPPLGVFISAIHPRDPDRFWLRILFAADATGSSPTSVYRSDDRGETWTEVAETRDSMLGFALSPDGERLAYGSLGGVFSGPSAGGAFDSLAALSNRCLTWAEGGLYACATEPADAFAVGITKSTSQPFEPFYRLALTCPQDCGDMSPFARACQPVWTDPAQGVAVLTRAQADGCTVAWARPPAASGGHDAGESGGASPSSGASSGGSGGGVKTPGVTVSNGSCSVVRAPPSHTALALATGLAVACAGRKRRKRARLQ